MPLHPFIDAMVQQLATRPALSAGTPQAARDMVAAGRAVLGLGPAEVTCDSLSIPGRGGPVPVRICRPAGRAVGVLVYIHGGGWVVGSLDDYETLARTLAAQSGCVVVLPDYRLAPEHPFPAGLHDCEDAIRWAVAQADDLTGGARAVAVAGDSAGANLATVALRRLRGEVSVALQALIYPVTDCDFATPSYRAHGTGLPLTTLDMQWFFDHYAPRKLFDSPDISCLRADDLTGMPPAVVVTAEFDVLASEGTAYAAALRAAGVPVVDRHIPGVTHGFIRLHNLFDVASDEVARLSSEIAAACGAARG